MRYTSAVVLSTLAVGQAAAANVHNRHSSFHERRHAEVKRDVNNVDWSKVAYDLKSVDWEKINWSSVFSAPGGQPTAQAAANPTPAAYSPQAQYTPDANTPAAPKPTPQAASQPAQAQPSAHATSDPVGNYEDGLQDFVGKLNALVGKNSKQNNGGIWIGNDSPWQVEFSNGGSRDAVLFCWKSNGYSGMIIKDNAPDISVKLKAGQTINLAFADKVPAACAPAFDNTKLAIFGGLDQTWFEVTFGSYGAFDISRNVNMNGDSIHAQGSLCTSDMNTCVFKCQDNSASSCMTGYHLVNCGSGTGGGGGFDAAMGGDGGGCSMGSTQEKITVTF